MIRFVLLAAVSFAAFAQQQSPERQTVGSESRTFTGVLVDATKSNCGPEVERAVGEGTCPPSFRTTDFGLTLAPGKQVKFDEAGNTKVVDALRKSEKGTKALLHYWRTGKASTQIKATAVGTLTSDTLNLESIRID